MTKPSLQLKYSEKRRKKNRQQKIGENILVCSFKPFSFSPFFVYCAQQIAFVLLSSFLIFVYISIGCGICTVHAVKIEQNNSIIHICLVYRL
jgi:hypothetical protein